MRHLFLIAYDVCDPSRLRKAYETMKGYGDPVQYSVFHCELSPMERQSLKQDLWEILDLTKDRVLLANLGPVEGRASTAIEFWGVPRELPAPRGPGIV